MVNIEELETEDDTVDVGEPVGSEETRPSPELLDPTPQQSTASSGATTLELPAAYRQEEPTLLQRAGSRLYAPVRQTIGHVRRRAQRNAQERDTTPDVTDHSQTPPTTPEQREQQTAAPRTPERDPLVREDPWQSAQARRPPQPPPAPTRDVWSTYTQQFVPADPGELGNVLFGRIPTASMYREVQPAPPTPPPVPQWQQQRPEQHFVRPRVHIPDLPEQSQSQVMQVQSSLAELNRLRLFHGGTLDMVPGEPGMQWDTNPLIPDISTNRDDGPLFQGPEFVAPGSRLPAQHPSEYDERMSQASSLPFPEERGEPRSSRPSSAEQTRQPWNSRRTDGSEPPIRYDVSLLPQNQRPSSTVFNPTYYVGGTGSRTADWVPPYEYDPANPRQFPLAFLHCEYWNTQQMVNDPRQHHPVHPDIMQTS